MCVKKKNVCKISNNHHAHTQDYHISTSNLMYGARFCHQGNSWQRDGNFGRTHREIDSKSGYIKPNLDCNYPFPVYLASNGNPFGAKPIRK